jgi:hypothetical protein
MAMTRRGFLRGLLASTAAVPALPVVVKAAAALPSPRTLYHNRSTRVWLDVQAIRDKNVLLLPGEYAGRAALTWRGVPIS